MTRLTATAIAAVLSTTIGLAAFVPATFAQEGPQRGMHQQFGNGHMQSPHGIGMPRMQILRQRMAAGGGRGTLLNLVCSDRAAERMEIGFVRLAYRLNLTDEQKALFDELKTATLTAQTSFADSCAVPGAGGDDDAESDAIPFGNPVERLTARLENDQTKLELMQPLLPKLEAFYDSLSEEQQASLQPRQRRMRGEGPGQPPAAPAEPMQPPAGEEDSAT